MYTWKYLKNAILYKLDIDENEAIALDYYNKFVVYANEAMTHICSIKPNRTFYNFETTSNIDNVNTENNIFETNTLINFPNDFISFGDGINTVVWKDKHNNIQESVVFDSAITYVGNKIKTFFDGKYSISYNARWIIFDNDIDENKELSIPIDVLECIPSYVASQCYKSDDENKAASYRNEFEMLLSRLDDSDFRNTKTFSIGGDW